MERNTFSLVSLFRLARLPQEFSRDDMAKLFEADGKTRENMRATLSRMISREMVMETPEGYKKLIE